MTEPDVAPGCYRHPDRPTWVKCTRCDRPICPDCMREASVGFQCPDCVAEGAAGQRAATTTFGGSAAASGTPVITYGLIAVNVVVFVLALSSGTVYGSATLTALHQRFSMLAAASPLPLPDGSFSAGVSGGEYYRLITAMFFHFGFAHIAFNMLALFSLGPRLEELFGRVRFAALYFGAGLCGNVASYVLAAPTQYSAGASTAIFGLFGAYFVVAKRMRADTSQIVGLLAINLVITFVIPNISWQGHLGGLAGGSLIALALVYAPRERRTMIQFAGTALVIGLALTLVFVRTAALTG